MEIKEYLIPARGYKDLPYAVNLSYTVLEASKRTILHEGGASYMQFPKLHCFLFCAVQDKSGCLILFGEEAGEIGYLFMANVTVGQACLGQPARKLKESLSLFWETKFLNETEPKIGQINPADSNMDWARALVEVAKGNRENWRICT